MFPDVEPVTIVTELLLGDVDDPITPTDETEPGVDPDTLNPLELDPVITPDDPDSVLDPTVNPDTIGDEAVELLGEVKTVTD